LKVYYLIYRIDNLINGKYYIGYHETHNIDDKYMGSGKYINRAVNKHGVSNFSKTILFNAFDRDSMKWAEGVLVTKFEVDNPMCYNLKVGGEGGFDHINNDAEMRTRNGEIGRRTIKFALAKNIELRLMNPDKYRAIAIKNLIYATQHNTGRLRPEHSILMKRLRLQGIVPSRKKRVYRVIWLGQIVELIGFDGFELFYNSLGFGVKFMSVFNDMPGYPDGDIDLDSFHNMGGTMRSTNTRKKIFKVRLYGKIIELTKTKMLYEFINSLRLKHRDTTVMIKTDGWKSDIIDLDRYIKEFGYAKVNE
jgi:hypothetical protein